MPSGSHLEEVINLYIGRMLDELTEKIYTYLLNPTIIGPHKMYIQGFERPISTLGTGVNAILGLDNMNILNTLLKKLKYSRVAEQMCRHITADNQKVYFFSHIEYLNDYGYQNIGTLYFLVHNTKIVLIPGSIDPLIRLYTINKHTQSFTYFEGIEQKFYVPTPKYLNKELKNHE